MSTVINVDSLSKKYIIRHEGRERYTTLRDILANSVKKIGKSILNPFSVYANYENSKEEFWALKGISFDVQKGEKIGIIGRNGAGKSTLLKLLSRITYPTEGQIRFKGRISSLLEVGTGFHPELTGRENIYLNGAILGMSKAEINRKFDEIVAFAEVEKFLDTPVKRYSTGMQVRLAFAVAAHLEPEILLVDEVLAVGDVQFQKKCLGKMKDIGRGNTTVLFVSHNMLAIEKLCTRCLLLEQGSLTMDGEPAKVISKYVNPDENLKKSYLDLEKRKDRKGSGEAIVTKVVIKNAQGIETNSLKMGESFAVDVYYKGGFEKGNAAINIINNMGVLITSANSYSSYPEEVNFETGKFSCYFQDNYLLNGDYSITVWLGSAHSNVDVITDCAFFTIEQADVYNTGKIHGSGNGFIFTNHKWDF